MMMMMMMMTMTRVTMMTMRMSDKSVSGARRFVGSQQCPWDRLDDLAAEVSDLTTRSAKHCRRVAEPSAHRRRVANWPDTVVLNHPGCDHRWMRPAVARTVSSAR